MKARIITDVPTLIEKAGGVMQLASIAGVARTTVLGWRVQGCIPGNRVVQISTALELPTEDVLKLVQPPKRRAKRSVPAPQASPPPHHKAA